MHSVAYILVAFLKKLCQEICHIIYRTPNGITIPFLTPAISAFEEAFITCGSLQALPLQDAESKSEAPSKRLPDLYFCLTMAMRLTDALPLALCNPSVMVILPFPCLWVANELEILTNSCNNKGYHGWILHTRAINNTLASFFPLHIAIG